MRAASPIALPSQVTAAGPSFPFHSLTEYPRYAGDLQHPADGRVLRIAARLQAPVRRPLDPSRLPAGRGRPDQRRRLQGAPAGARPRRAGGAGVAQAARQGDGRPRHRRRSQGLRSGRALHAGAAIPLAWRARTARCGGEVAGAVHVDHEHAAAALREAHPGPRLRGARAGLHRARVWDTFDPEDHHAQQPRPAGDPSAGREGERADGHAADQLQMRAVRRRQVDRRSSASSRRTSTPRASTRRRARSSCR